MKKIIAFDVDGTLTLSKAALSASMAVLIERLLSMYTVALVSGGAFSQFQKQILDKLTSVPDDVLSNLVLFPTNGACMYRYTNHAWRAVYQEPLTAVEKKQIIQILEHVLAHSGIVMPSPSYGPIVEDRKTQVTFSALGQNAPLEQKQMWDPDQTKRKTIKAQLDMLLPNFEIKIGGTTSIDITHKGIDKAYAIGKIEQQLDVTKEEMLFVGDALFEGGNDYAVKTTGVECIAVKDPDETAEIIKQLLGKQ